MHNIREEYMTSIFGRNIQANILAFLYLDHFVCHFGSRWDLAVLLIHRCLEWLELKVVQALDA